MKKGLKYVLTFLLFLYMIFIWILSSMPADALLDTPFSFDYMIRESLHLIEFGILYWLFAFSLLVQGKWTRKMSAIAAIVSILYGGIDEIHQHFVPYRTSTIIDLIKDAIGVLVSYAVMNKYFFTDKQTKLKHGIHHALERMS